MSNNNTENFVGLVIGSSDERIKILCADGIVTLNCKLKVKPQLFSIAEFTTIKQRIITTYIIEQNHELTKDIKKYYLACAICEVVAKIYPNKDIFLLTVKAFDMLKENNNTREIFTFYFLNLLELLGYGCEHDQDINTAFIRHLDIQIPNTKHFL